MLLKWNREFFSRQRVAVDRTRREWEVLSPMASLRGTNRCEQISLDGGAYTAQDEGPVLWVNSPFVKKWRVVLGKTENFLDA